MVRLYVVDMYRAVIEHPEFMPPELKRRPDLTLGKDRGRIWRIVPEGHKTTAMRPKLSRDATADLVPLLAQANAWWRTTAQRLLLERQDRAAVEPLRNLCTTSVQPLARVHSAWLLEGLNALDADLVVRLLDDESPRVREQALILCERWLPTSTSMQKKVLALADDADARVRFQAALSLGEWNDDRIVPALATIAAADADNRWTRAAVASAVPRRAGALLTALLKPARKLTAQATPGRLAIVQELAALVGARARAERSGRPPRCVAGADRQRGRALADGRAERLGRRYGPARPATERLPARSARRQSASGRCR